MADNDLTPKQKYEKARREYNRIKSCSLPYQRKTLEHMHTLRLEMNTALIEDAMRKTHHTGPYPQTRNDKWNDGERAMARRLLKILSEEDTT